MSGNNELVNVMTDMTGPFNRVIMVTKYDNLTAYEQSWEKVYAAFRGMKKNGGSNGRPTRTCTYRVERNFPGLVSSLLLY
jgi:hypothetical protein